MTSLATAADLVRYDVTDVRIAELRAEYAGLTFDTPAAYETGRKAIATIRELRVAVEKRRKELKAESLEFGRLVDSAARHLTGRLEDVEAPLIAARDAVDAEKERIKAEKERARVAEIEAKLKAEREAQEAIERAAREAQEAIERAAREAEEARLREERVRLEAERAAFVAAAKVERDQMEAARREADARAKVERDRIKAEQDALDAQRHALEAEQRAAEAAAFERAEAERRKIEAERRHVEQLELAERGRLARLALAPDIDKVAEFAKRIRAVMSPPVLCSTQVASAFLATAVADLEDIARNLEAFMQRSGT